MICAGIALAVAFSVHDVALTVALLVPAFSFSVSPSAARSHPCSIFPNQVRGFASSFCMLILKLGGMSLGSFLPGFCNDYMFHDEMQIGQSLVLTVTLASMIGACLFRFTYAAYRRDYVSQNG